MAVAHFIGIKVPVLFVYYDTPFYAYQDKIISFAVCAYIALFYSASKHRDVALTAIVVLGLTVAGLSAVNLSEALAAVLTEGQSTFPYWLQTGAIAFYFAVLLGLYVKDGKDS
jgi:D-arabinose 1-dehydrogenase-like Zn-dependent alcohol dehydrogenase